jgi:hypothetical protein
MNEENGYLQNSILRKPTTADTSVTNFLYLWPNLPKQKLSGINCLINGMQNTAAKYNKISNILVQTIAAQVNIVITIQN